MAFVEWLKAILLGIIQGITEWLPVSSTGHMLLFDDFFPMQVSAAFRDMFMVVIQFGSILAVVVLFWGRLVPFGKNKTPETKRSIWRLWGKVLIGVIPAGVAGLLLDDWITGIVYHNNIVKCAVIAGALILYGVGFIVVERCHRGKEDRVATVDDLTWRDALGIGCFQVLSLIPGTSRSGSTILGGILMRVSRTAAAEFSFFLAIPVMLGASGLKGLKFFLAGNTLTGQEAGLLLCGMAVAFLVSLVVIRFLMDFVRRHSFEAFGWYRIALGCVIVIYLMARYVPAA